MNLRRAALLAAVGVVLRGVYFCITNLIPSLGASDLSAQVMMLMVDVVDPLAWMAFFVAIRQARGVRATSLIVAGISVVEVAVNGQHQFPTFSLLSSNTAKFILGAFLPALCWVFVLLRFAGLPVKFRLPSVYLILFCLARLGVLGYEFVDSFGQIGAFWSIEPQLVAWRLIATPMIWMFYWITQALFLRWAPKTMK
jgi:hypothetical protein